MEATWAAQFPPAPGIALHSHIKGAANAIAAKTSTATSSNSPWSPSRVQSSYGLFHPAHGMVLLWFRTHEDPERHGHCTLWQQMPDLCKMPPSTDNTDLRPPHI